MASINYFINMHGFLLLVLTVLLTIAFTFSCVFVIVKLSKRYRWSNRTEKLVFLPLCLSALFGGIVGLSCLVEPHNDGGVREIFYVDSTPSPQITALLIRIHSKRGGVDFDVRLKSFDLAYGAPLGMTEMVSRGSDTYTIFRQSDRFAWGYGEMTGPQYLDLAETAYLPSARVLGKRPRRTVGLKGRHVDPWQLEPVEGSLGYCAHARGNRPADGCLTLLKPETPAELNRDVSSLKQRWIVHRSAFYGESELLASYLDAEGAPIAEINLSRFFNNNDVRVLNTVTTGDAVYLFAALGHSIFGDIKGFSLKGLKTDIRTGVVIDVVSYF